MTRYIAAKLQLIDTNGQTIWTNWNSDRAVQFDGLQPVRQIVCIDEDTTWSASLDASIKFSLIRDR